MRAVAAGSGSNLFSGGASASGCGGKEHDELEEGLYAKDIGPGDAGLPALLPSLSTDALTDSCSSSFGLRRGLLCAGSKDAPVAGRRCSYCL